MTGTYFHFSSPPSVPVVPEGDVLPRLGRDCAAEWCGVTSDLPSTGWSSTLLIAAVALSAIGWLVITLVPPSKGRRRRDRPDRV